MLPEIWRQWRKYHIGMTSHMLFNPFTPLLMQRALINSFGHMPWLAADVAEHNLQLGARPARRFGSPATDGAAVVFFHGGGFTTGSLTSHRPLCSHLAKVCGIPVYSIDYRLAPEHPYPAAADDCEAATLALLQQPGIAADKLILAGDSAGGNLALVTALRLHRHNIRPAALVLMSPWSDPVDTELPWRFDPILNPYWGMASARAYRGDSNGNSSDFAPINADLADLACLPPVLLQADDDEILLPQLERLAERLRAAGVNLTYQVYRDLWHAGQIVAAIHPPAAAALAECGRYVQEVLAASPLPEAA